MKTGTIYCIENKVNGKKYVGMSTDYKRRWENHKKYLDKDGHHNIYLQRSWNKYGKENFKFKILEDNIKEENLSDREIYWIDFYDTFEGKGYNLTKGGEGTFGFSHSELTKEKISKASLGTIHTEETKKKISEAHKGRVFTEEHKRKISETLKGREFSEEHKVNLSKALKGNKLSEKTKKKLSEAHKGKKFSEETRKELSKTRQGEDNPSSKITKEQGLEIYQKYHSDNSNLSYSDLAEEYDVHKETIGGIARCTHWTTKHLK